jgi:hypothetical protein
MSFSLNCTEKSLLVDQRGAKLMIVTFVHKPNLFSVFNSSQNLQYTSPHLKFLLFIFYYFERLSVRVIQSSRAGMGKSLMVNRLAEKLNRLYSTIPLHGIYVDGDRVTRTLLSRDIPVSRIFNLGMSQSVSSTQRLALKILKRSDDRQLRPCYTVQFFLQLAMQFYS